VVESTAVHIYYSDHHAVPLPPGHRFPMGKYARLRARLVDDAVVPAAGSRRRRWRAGPSSSASTTPTTSRR
jgi:hypothetical protein